MFILQKCINLHVHINPILQCCTSYLWTCVLAIQEYPYLFSLTNPHHNIYSAALVLTCHTQVHVSLLLPHGPHTHHRECSHGDSCKSRLRLSQIFTTDWTRVCCSPIHSNESMLILVTPSQHSGPCLEPSQQSMCCFTEDEKKTGEVFTYYVEYCTPCNFLTVLSFSFIAVFSSFSSLISKMFSAPCFCQNYHHHHKKF
jgi:hypothetical protein